ncbi:hypothetical protein B2J86_04735 [Acidovorax sp. SRB_14]|uniref:DUF2917 domain-containing protein n=1 Tax=unclassified Acidovorax TaxID=2684926 RepID=UPI00145FA0A3|nr:MULTISPECIES: DUF2917 domain-containing protein [unclassified Acidovorax]NMM77618.1 hypothetical protein [Acidovorax sp. SRB_24]NMM80243.1 hypothetical protein [Acidovorax sp. SRB_14]NMM86774.1 hypothetical protein [Rhodococcus sp. SRB_17]
MAASTILNSQQSAVRGTAGSLPAPLCRLGAGSARSLRPREPVALRVARGQAWVTLGAGPHGEAAQSADVFVAPGQTLWLVPGQQVVLEPVGPEGVHYQLGGLAGASVSRLQALRRWWQRHGTVEGEQGACCA